MIDRPAIADIISLYAKHGWTLRRVLLSDELRAHLSTTEVFGDVAVEISDLDAAWFSRSSKPDQTAWEIRHLSEVPFALVEVLPTGAGNAEAAETFKEAEMRMAEIMTKKKRAI